MENYYEINVARLIPQRGYIHFFATAPRSISTKDQMEEIFEILKEKFPVPEYNITVTKWECVGMIIKDVYE